ncbi:MAG: ABC transporter permease subunit [Synechococcaceae bacterium WBB_32_011]|nr:ABC transporter permease subunit [Synechococcaceae bacterium WB5_2A_257]NDA75035.1 ABC transporter permease subunit [Synechococcaceae bacterium WB8_3_299]NDD21543.1 ABC transporter permease subunit [Synechococcaceae bacterium WBA_3_309]NDE21746.1 ABC transporter permease subunit [Synechococcaceae bacterium WB9_3_282]NDG00148.1 ABC transporter permease subunit [Synechococcaceae bacterium WBB_32_011]
MPVPWWRDNRKLGWLIQLVAGLFILFAIALLLGNLERNLARAGLQLTLGWLNQPAGFDIAETLLPYRASDSYGSALLAGFINTLRVVVSGLVLATALGVAVGAASFSGNPLLRGVTRVYVELIRNIPLLLQLVFWYFAVFLSLPSADQALHLPGMQLAKSGIYLFGADLVNGELVGGVRLSLELAALLTGLVIYSAAFIAEVVRGGIASVPLGQWEAAKSLGLKPLQILRLVVLPQALRVIVPGLNSQYISLAKNSSLAVAIGYPDLYAVAETTLNQTGRGIEVFLLLLVVYLMLDLVISVVMNAIDRLVRLQER